MKISDKEIASILAEVEAELAPLLRSERQRLSKAAEDSAGSASPMGEESRSPGRDLMPDERSGSASGSPEASASASGSPMGSPEGSASASGSPMPEGSASAGSPEGSAGGGGDVQELAAQYAQLSPEDLESHLMAIEMAMQQMQGGAAGGAPAGMPPEAGGAGMPPAAPPAQAGAMPPPEGSPTMKSEGLNKGMLTWAPYTTLHHVATQHEKEHGAGAWDKEHPDMTIAHIKENMDKEGSAAKERSASREKSASAPAEKSAGSFSKNELDAVNAKLDVALKAVEFLTRPMRKAVTEFAVTETKAASSMTKGEVTAKLKEVTASPTLAKSDRNLVNGFYDGRVSLDQIAHLLK